MKYTVFHNTIVQLTALLETLNDKDVKNMILEQSDCILSNIKNINNESKHNTSDINNINSTSNINNNSNNYNTLTMSTNKKLGKKKLTHTLIRTPNESKTLHGSGITSSRSKKSRERVQHRKRKKIDKLNQQHPIIDINQVQPITYSTKSNRQIKKPKLDE